MLASPPPVIFDTRRMAEVLGIQTTKKLVDGLKETKEWLQSSREQQWAPYPEESDGLMKSADAAMKGGIDIRDIGVYHDKGVKKIRFDEASLQSMRTEGFRGFAPVILSIQPIQDLQVAMGLPGQ